MAGYTRRPRVRWPFGSSSKGVTWGRSEGPGNGADGSVKLRRAYEQTARRVGRVPDLVWVPLAAGVLMAVVGVIGVAASQPWLFPSLGPTAYIQAAMPDRPFARLYNTFVGHMVGLAAGFVALAVTNAWGAPNVLTTYELTPVRVWAVAIALALTMLGSLLLRSLHPPAGATTLLVALGSFQAVRDAVVVVIGVAILSAIGELVRRVRDDGRRMGTKTAPQDGRS